MYFNFFFLLLLFGLVSQVESFVLTEDLEGEAKDLFPIDSETRALLQAAGQLSTHHLDWTQYIFLPLHLYHLSRLSHHTFSR